MKKRLFPAILVLLFSFLFIQHAVAEELTIKKAEQQGTWKILNSKGEQVGTLRTAEDGAYSVQLPSGDYMGFILKTGDLKKTQRHPLISPAEARLYLDIWAAIRKMK